MPLARPRLSSSARDRQRELGLAITARRRLVGDRRAPGRVWINGREVGGAQGRFAHLERAHD